MNKIILVAFLTVLSAFGYAQKTDLASEAGALLEEAVKEKAFAGISAGIYKDNAIVWEDGRGYLDIEKKEKADGAMLHRIASISKPMTAVAIMQLVEKGRIDLDAPIQQYVPEFPQKKKGEVTVRGLLNHTSGIPTYRNAKENFPTIHYANLTEAVTIFKDRPLGYVPGTDYVYSTYAYTLAGLVIERVTGMEYADYMRKNIWGKAGMTHTDIEEFGKKYPNKASLYKKEANGAFSSDIPSDLSVKYPGGGLHATAGDLLRFGEAILENTLITPSSLETMMQDPGVKKGTPYGLGWDMVNDPEYGRIIKHVGGQSGTSTLLVIYLDKKMVISALSNASRTGNEVQALVKKLAALATEGQ